MSGAPNGATASRLPTSRAARPPTSGAARPDIPGGSARNLGRLGGEGSEGDGGGSLLALGGLVDLPLGDSRRPGEEHPRDGGHRGVEVADRVVVVLPGKGQLVLGVGQLR